MRRIHLPETVQDELIRRVTDGLRRPLESEGVPQMTTLTATGEAVDHGLVMNKPIQLARQLGLASDRRDEALRELAESYGGKIPKLRRKTGGQWDELVQRANDASVHACLAEALLAPGTGAGRAEAQGSAGPGHEGGAAAP